METVQEIGASETPPNAEPLKSIEVYQADAFGFFLFATIASELALQRGEFNIPFGAKKAAPPAVEAGFAARSSGTETWVVVEDHRSDVLFYSAIPGAASPDAEFEQYQIGQRVTVNGQIVSYDGGGPIPEWLTTVKPD